MASTKGMVMRVTSVQQRLNVPEFRDFSVKARGGQCCKASREQHHVAASSSTISRPPPPDLRADGQHGKEKTVDPSSPHESAAQSKFSWTKAWYPVAVASHLPADRPTAIRLLGEGLVLWKSGSGDWKAFKDMCPHRLAPLSEGRVENGNIVCSYHGWAFEGEQGKCVQIPQAADKKSLTNACNSNRACCINYPCKVIGDLIWVFGSAGDAAEAESQKVATSAVPELTDGSSFHFPWFVRDLPYDASVLLENVIDPSHVPHSHHGVQGNRFEANTLQMKPAENLDAKEGFSVLVHEADDTPKEKRRAGVPYHLYFRPPALIQYKFKTGGQLISYATPTDPGRSRIVFTVAIKAEKLSKVAKLIFKVLGSKWLDWKSHLTRNNVLDGDNVFLAFQDHELRIRDKSSWNKYYYTPTSLDSGVRALNTWLTTLAEQVPWAPGAKSAQNPAALPRRQLLDRFHSHTKICPSCSMAHATFSRLRWVAGGVIFACSLLLASRLSAGMHWKRLLLPVLGILLSLGTALKAEKYKQLMEFNDYRHPEH